MPDSIDLIQEMATAQSEYLNRLRTPESFVSATFCLDCDEPIPDIRRQMVPGVERCVICQTLTEHPNYRAKR